MKRVAALLTAIVLCQLLFRATAHAVQAGQVYRPEPPPQSTHLLPSCSGFILRTGNVTLLYTLSSSA